MSPSRSCQAVPAAFLANRLPGALRLDGLPGASRERDRPARSRALDFAEPPAVALHPAHRPADRQAAIGHVGPRQAEQLAAAEPGGRGEGVQRPELVIGGRVQELRQVTGGEVRDRPMLDVGRGGIAGHVAAHEPGPLRVRERPAERRADVASRDGRDGRGRLRRLLPIGQSRGAPRLILRGRRSTVPHERRERILHVGRGEPGQRLPAECRDQVDPDVGLGGQPG